MLQSDDAHEKWTQELYKVFYELYKVRLSQISTTASINEESILYFFQHKTPQDAALVIGEFFNLKTRQEVIDEILETL